MLDNVGAPRRFRLAWAGFILLLTLLPYAVNACHTPPGQVYTWIIPPYPADAYAYRAWAMQAYNGRWLFSLKFTARPNPAVLFLPFFLAAGKLARLSGADIGLVFLLMKSVGVCVFFAAFYAFLRQWRLSPTQSVAASVFVGVAAGLGGLTPWVFPGGLPLGWVPVDAWLVDSNTFWSLLWNPLYPYSLALILTAVACADRGARDGDAVAAWFSGLCLGALALLHPYPLAVLYPLLTALCVVRRPKGWRPILARIIGASLPATGYVVAAAILDPSLRAHNTLGTGGAVSMFAYASGFGLLPWLAVAGAAAGGREFLRRHWPLMLWIALSAALCSSPLWFHNKYVFGAHLPLCLLAGAAVDPLLVRFGWRPSRAAAAAALAFAAMPLTQFVHLREAVAVVTENADGEYRLSAGMKKALEFLREHSRPQDVVFAEPKTSGKVCAFAGNTVFWGHWAQSVDFDARQDWIMGVLSGASPLTPEQRRRRFWDPAAGVDYLFLDGIWRELFKTAPAAALLAGAEKIYGSDEVDIYRRVGGASSRANIVRQDSSAAASSGSPISRR